MSFTLINCRKEAWKKSGFDGIRTRDFAFCVTITTEKISWIMLYGCLLEIFLTEQSLIISDR